MQIRVIFISHFLANQYMSCAVLWHNDHHIGLSCHIHDVIFISVRLCSDLQIYETYSAMYTIFALAIKVAEICIGINRYRPISIAIFGFYKLILHTSLDKHLHFSAAVFFVIVH